MGGGLVLVILGISGAYVRSRSQGGGDEKPLLVYNHAFRFCTDQSIWPHGYTGRFARPGLGGRHHFHALPGALHGDDQTHGSPARRAAGGGRP